jgi:uncharacterized protein YndB with AHSA1/START domain
MNADWGKTERARHGSFMAELELPAPTGDVFAAYAELPVRRRWFRMPGRPDGEHELDFRVGGTERVAATFAPYGDGRAEHMAYRSHFLDIVPERRIVWAYRFELDGERHLVSLVTVELSPSGAGTAVRHTEQYAFLAVTGNGGDDVAHLRGSTRLQLNGLLAALESDPAGSDVGGN